MYDQFDTPDASRHDFRGFIMPKGRFCRVIYCSFCFGNHIRGCLFSDTILLFECIVSIKIIEETTGAFSFHCAGTVPRSLS